MKLIDLLKKYSDVHLDDVENTDNIYSRICKLYYLEDTIKYYSQIIHGYNSTIKELITATELLESNFTIVLEKKKYSLTLEEYIDITGKEKDTNNVVALEFEKWGSILNSECEITIDELDFLAHTLWEITFLGFDPETIEEKKKEILSDLFEEELFSLESEDYNEWLISEDDYLVF